MNKSRILKSAIACGVKAAKETGDINIKSLSDEELEGLVELMVDYQLLCVKEEMLSGEVRAVIPKIGSFTKKVNKKIMYDIQKKVLDKHGFDVWYDVPKEMRPHINQEIERIAKDKFQRMKKAKRSPTSDIADKAIDHIKNMKKL